MSFIPYGKQLIDSDDIKAVESVLQSDWLTQGPNIQKFEEGLAEYCGAKYAVAVSSGTAALHIASLAIGVKQGDEVLSSPNTFVATTNSVLYAKGTPVFVDINPQTFNIDETLIEKEINNKTKGIIPVHFAGQPANMPAIHKIAKKYNLFVIEDACHALGAQYKDENGDWVKVGSCKHSDLAVLSFHPVKHITTGEGGAVLTNSKELYEKLIMLRTHGITKDPEKLSKNEGPWYYEMQTLGYNYRITDIQCALGLSQLQKNNKWIIKRREIAEYYNNAFKNILEIQTPIELETNKSAYHLYVLQIDFEKLNITRKNLMNKLKENGIGTQVHYIPVCNQPYYIQNVNKYPKERFECCQFYYKKAISIPMYHSMNESNMNTVVNTLQIIIQA